MHLQLWEGREGEGRGGEGKGVCVCVSCGTWLVYLRMQVWAWNGGGHLGVSVMRDYGTLHELY